MFDSQTKKRKSGLCEVYNDDNEVPSDSNECKSLNSAKKSKICTKSPWYMVHNSRV